MARMNKCARLTPVDGENIGMKVRIILKIWTCMKLILKMKNSSLPHESHLRG